MNTRAIAGVALVGAVILVSCAKDQTSAPALLPTEASFAKPVIVNYCSFSNISNAARNYFASRTDQVYSLIDAMNTAYKAGGTSAKATNSAGFAVLGRLGEAADAKGTAAGLTAAQGSIFANAVLKCMSVGGYVAGDADYISFAAALSDSGLFAVRDTGQSTAVKSRGLDADGLPMFGAEPTTNGTSSKWPIQVTASPSGKALFYGAKTKAKTETLANEDLSSLAFELSTLPSPLTFSPKILVGVCSIDALSARTIHRHATAPNTFATAILAPGGVLSFCSTTTGAVSPNLSSFAYATQRLANWFSPKPAYAFALRGGGGAGLVDGLSEFGAVEYTPSILWTAPPNARTTLNANPQFAPIIVTVTTVKDGKPNVPYVGTVTLQIVGNSGSFTNPPVGSSTETDANGVATFNNLYIDKAGGYTVTAVTGIGSSAPVTFWINGQ
jgi:hypothetical protein